MSLHPNGSYCNQKICANSFCVELQKLQCIPDIRDRFFVFRGLCKPRKPGPSEGKLMTALGLILQKVARGKSKYYCSERV